MGLTLYSENMVLSPVLWDSWDDGTKMLYTFFANLNGPEAAIQSKGIGMLLRNAAKIKPSYNYSKRSKIYLFNLVNYRLAPPYDHFSKISKNPVDLFPHTSGSKINF